MKGEFLQSKQFADDGEQEDSCFILIYFVDEFVGDLESELAFVADSDDVGQDAHQAPIVDTLDKLIQVRHQALAVGLIALDEFPDKVED